MSRSVETSADAGPSVLARFSPACREWFAATLGAPTPAQEQAWRAIAAGDHALVVAPTGSGKTLAAFLWAIDSLTHLAPRTRSNARCRVLYVSPLKALAADVERNLRVPLEGIALLDPDLASVSIAMRTGDTPQKERRRFATAPADILITTPESLYLLLTSRAREALRGVETVIVDELHSLLPTKRGAHLTLSLERLDALATRPVQRIGLSATVEPVHRAAEYLSGVRPLTDGGRPVTIAHPHSAKSLTVRVEVPVPDLTDLNTKVARDEAAAASLPEPEPRSGSNAAPASALTTSIWEPIAERIVTHVAAHRSTLVFANSRRAAERLAARLNEEWARRCGLEVPEAGAVWPAAVQAQSGAATGAAPTIARAHHGSMSAIARREIEAELKSGRLRCVVATSTLELGIDMGAIEHVIMLGAPPSISSGLQRIGRAGHQVGATSQGTIVPIQRGELLPSAVIADEIARGHVEEQRWPASPLDVLAQQLIAMAAIEPIKVTDAAAIVRRAAPFQDLGDRSLQAVLDMLAGHYPSDDFAALRPRLTWDRDRDLLTARPGTHLTAVRSGGTIPDSGLFGVYLSESVPTPDGPQEAETTARPAQPRPRGARRVGELDEEMVYESRVGDRITLGTTTWRIQAITPDRVLVAPAPGEPGRLPFWKGDTPGRPEPLSRKIGAMTRELLAAGEQSRRERLDNLGLDAWAAKNLLAYLDEQREQAAVPDDRTIVIETFPDELGDNRVALHSVFGARVNAPWALLIVGALAARFGITVQHLAVDDGALFHLPEGRIRLQPEDLLPAGRSVPELTATLAGALAASPQFAARFRQAAGRALLLPRPAGSKRQPLWQQRHRAASLLGAAARFPDFPILHEAVRECLQDDWDVDALAQLLDRLANGDIDIVMAETTRPSPFARTMLLAFTGANLYDGDVPLAEERAAALSLDPQLLRELVGGADEAIGELVPPQVAASLADDLARRSPRYRPASAEQLYDWLRVAGPLRPQELAAAADPDAPTAIDVWLTQLLDEGRAIEITDRAGAAGFVVASDAGRAMAAGFKVDGAVLERLPGAFLAPHDGALDLTMRLARHRVAVSATELAAQLGMEPRAAAELLERLIEAGRLVRLAPPAAQALGACGGHLAVIEPDVLDRLRRRALGELRRQVRPVGPAQYARFLGSWQRLGELAGPEAVPDAVEALAGARVPASALEGLVLPARLTDYRPEWLDAAISAGDVVWVGQGAAAGRDGWLRLLPASGELDPLATLDPLPVLPGADRVLEALTGGALFSHELRAALQGPDATAPADAPGRSDAAARTGSAEIDGSLIDLAQTMWQLAWAGWVTSDSLRPVRAFLARRPAASRPAAAPTVRRATLRTQLRTSALRAASQAPARPEAEPWLAGRWSLTPMARAERSGRTPAPTERAHSTAVALANRYGVVAQAACSVESSLAELYPVYAALEGAGAIRRGLFVDSLGAAQFAVPQAIDLLRSAAKEPDPDGAAFVLAAVDPANPYGLLVPWPVVAATEAGARPARRAGASLVLASGAPLLYLESGNAALLTFTEDPAALGAAASAIADAVAQRRLGAITLKTIDATPALQARAAGHPVARALEEHGFVPSPMGLRHRAP